MRARMRQRHRAAACTILKRRGSESCGAWVLGCPNLYELPIEVHHFKTVWQRVVWGMGTRVPEHYMNYQSKRKCLQWGVMDMRARIRQRHRAAACTILKRCDSESCDAVVLVCPNIYELPMETHARVARESCASPTRPV